MTKPSTPRAWNSTLPRATKGLARSAGIGSGTRKPVKRKNAKRQKAEGARCYGTKAFRDWLHARPCAVCGFSGLPSEQAHARGGGAGRKADWQQTLPMCRRRLTYFAPGVIEGCHAESHRVGIKTFEKQHSVSLIHLAAQTQLAWLVYLNRSA